MNYVCYGEEREGRYYSEEFDVWYDVYPCKDHGLHIDIDHGKEW